MRRMLAINWEPELRGILTVIMGVGRADGPVYLVLGTNLGARLGFLVTLAGLAGWMALMGGDLVDLRHRSQGRRAAVGGGARPDRDPDIERCTGGRARRSRSTFAGATPRSAPKADLVADAARRRGLGRVDESAPSSVRPRRPPACSSRGRRSRRASSTSPTCSRSAARRTRRLGDELDLIAFWHKPHYTLVEVAPFEPLRDRTGSGADATRDRHVAAAPVRVHDPRPRLAARAGGLHLHRLDDRVPAALLVCCTGATGSSPRTCSRQGARRGLTMGQYLPIVALMVLAVLFGALSFVASRSAGAASSVGGQGGAVRVRHRAQPRATRTLPGQLLRRGDAVRHVRHRDHLHLPVRRRASARSARSGSGRSSCSR